MKCMYAQTRPRFILSSEGVLGGMEFEPMLTPREKSPLPENVPRGVSNPRHCGSQFVFQKGQYFVATYQQQLSPLLTTVSTLKCRRRLTQNNTLFSFSFLFLFFFFFFLLSSVCTKSLYGLLLGEENAGPKATR